MRTGMCSTRIHSNAWWSLPRWMVIWNKFVGLSAKAWSFLFWTSFWLNTCFGWYPRRSSLPLVILIWCLIWERLLISIRNEFVLLSSYIMLLVRSVVWVYCLLLYGSRKIIDKVVLSLISSLSFRSKSEISNVNRKARRQIKKAAYIMAFFLYLYYRWRSNLKI
jgi:hypothetical protein